MVMADGKTCLIRYGTELRPGQAVEEIRLKAIINFNAGDKPLFSTGVIDPIIDTCLLDTSQVQNFTLIIVHFSGLCQQPF